MEKTTKVSEAAHSFFQVLRAVRKGQSYILTGRGQPIARITPIEPKQTADAKPHSWHV